MTWAIPTQIAAKIRAIVEPIRRRSDGPDFVGTGRFAGRDAAAERCFDFGLAFALDWPALERDELDEARVEVDREAVLLERLAGEDPRTSTSGSA
jgi:hypothetical protein